MPQAKATDAQQNTLLKQRQEKAQFLSENGVKLYSNSFKAPIPIAEVVPRGEQLAAESYEQNGNTYRVGGRIMSMRKFGKAAFFHIQDESGRMQIYARRDIVGDEQFNLFKKWDIGDIVGVHGRLFKTKTGELSVQAFKAGNGHQVPAAAAGEISRPDRCGNPLSPALRRPDRQSRGAGHLPQTGGDHPA